MVQVKDRSTTVIYGRRSTRIGTFEKDLMEGDLFRQGRILEIELPLVDQ